MSYKITCLFCRKLFESLLSFVMEVDRYLLEYTGQTHFAFSDNSRITAHTLIQFWLRNSRWHDKKHLVLFRPDQNRPFSGCIDKKARGQSSMLTTVHADNSPWGQLSMQTNLHADNHSLDICPEGHSSNSQFFNRLISIWKCVFEPPS